MTTVQKLSTWIPVTKEMLADAPDIRIYVASNGYELHARVGWREVMYRAISAIRRERYPEDYRDEDDD